MMEEWKPLTGYNGYEISSFGNIRSLDRFIIRSDGGVRFIKGRLLKFGLDGRGYPRIRIGSDVNKKSLRIHRLVALHFLDLEEGKDYVNHIDGVKTNNKVTNLEWVTNLENMRHATETGLITRKSGREAARFVSDVEVFDKEGNYLYSLSGNKEMVEHGFDYRLVSACVCGKRKTHKGHIFKRRN